MLQEGYDAATANAGCTLSKNHVHLLPSLAKHAGRIRTSPEQRKGRGRVGQSVEQQEGLRIETYESRAVSDRRNPASHGFSIDPTYYSTSLPEHAEAWSTATLLIRMSISLSVW